MEKLRTLQAVYILCFFMIAFMTAERTRQEAWKNCGSGVKVSPGLFPPSWSVSGSGSFQTALMKYIYKSLTSQHHYKIQSYSALTYYISRQC